MSPKRQSVTLDILRGGCALLIVIFHYTSHYNTWPEHAATRFDFPLEIWWGYAAVVSFFMLSGYLAAPVLDVKRMPAGKFVWKKLKRFYPEYWAAMSLTTIVLACLYTEQSIGLVQYVANLTMVSQIFTVPFIDGAYWSMQCELVFCLIIAAMLFVRKSSNIDKILLLWIILAIAMTVIPGKALRFFRIVVINRYAFAFIAGIVLSRIQTRQITMTLAAVILALCGAHCVVLYGLFSPAMGFLIATSIVLTVAKWLDTCIKSGWIWVRAICWVAAISYPLYLVHEMTGFAIMRQMHRHGLTHWSAVLVPIAFALAAAYAINRSIRYLRR